MRKIEQKLLERFKQRKNVNSEIDTINVEVETKSIYYYNYGCLVFAKIIDENKETIYFCLASYKGRLSFTTKSRINAFLSLYDLHINQRNYKYFCNNQEIKLDTVYSIGQNDNDGKYYINGVVIYD